LNPEDKKLLTGMIVHTVDLSGATKEFKMASIWSKRVSEEFSNQVNILKYCKKLYKT
jgi:hypothetical protein